MQAQAEIMKLDGRIDAFTVAPLEQWLATAEVESSVNRIVNLADVTFIDTKAITVLVSGLKRCRQSGGDLVLSAVSAPVRVIIELMRLDKAFTMTTDDTTARALFRSA